MEQKDNNIIPKISFFMRIKWAIFNLENYDIFAVEHTKKAVGYFAKLLLIFALITAIGITYKFANIDLRTVPEIAESVSAESLQYIESLPKNELYIVFYIVAAIYLYFSYFIITMIDVLLLSILGYLTSRVSKINLKYIPIVNISVYSLTLSIVLSVIYILVNSITGFEIKYFQIMYNSIAYIYLVTAILMIKSEMIKQEIELAKLAEEQQKVKKELEQKEKEDKQEENEKEDNDKDEKKEEKNNKDETPEGSSAIMEQK